MGFNRLFSHVVLKVDATGSPFATGGNENGLLHGHVP